MQNFHRNLILFLRKSHARHFLVVIEVGDILCDSWTRPQDESSQGPLPSSLSKTLEEVDPGLSIHHLKCLGPEISLVWEFFPTLEYFHTYNEI